MGGSRFPRRRRITPCIHKSTALLSGTILRGRDPMGPQRALVPWGAAAVEAVLAPESDLKAVTGAPATTWRGEFGSIVPYNCQLYN